MTPTSCSRPGRCRLSAAEPPTGEDPMDTVTGPAAPCVERPCVERPCVERPGPPSSLTAIILAGGAAARLHGADKPALEVGGVPMLVSVARAAAAAGAERVIVVGPERAGCVARGLAEVAVGVTVRESPPGGGRCQPCAVASRRTARPGSRCWRLTCRSSLAPRSAGLWSAAASASCDEAGALRCWWPAAVAGRLLAGGCAHRRAGRVPRAVPGRAAGSLRPVLR